MPFSRPVRALITGSALALFVTLFSVNYTVERGDTLGRIARDHGVSVSDLAEANGIADPNLIFPGQVLVIPGEDDGETVEEVIHVVSRGETLARIAAHYATSVMTLVSANSISNPNRILIGQELIIPSSTDNDGGSSSSDDGSATSGSSSAANESSAVSPPGLRSGRYHVVKKGESVEQIAAQYSGVSAADIALTNGILNGVIYTGTRLFLDGPGYTAEGAAGEKVYTVQGGDRLGDIAHANGVSVSTLVEFNSIINPNLIKSGQDLLIPTGTAWMCPVGESSFFNDWGFPRGGGTRFHEGNDLFTDHGSPVRAPVSGTVEFVTGTIGGNQFRLYGDDGIKYIGTHMSSFGQDGPVHAGDVVGFVGTTGNAQGTRPHLHFGMYYKDTVINPYPTLMAHECKG